MIFQINIDTNAPVEDMARIVGLNLKDADMGLNEYQQVAARTIDEDMLPGEIETHALLGMVAEIGELHGLYQKIYQGHEADSEHLKEEVGDLLWFIAEYCTACGWDLEEVAWLNIAKLKARCPDSFEVERSLHRAAGDV